MQQKTSEIGQSLPMATLPEPFGLQQSMLPTIGRNGHIPMWSVLHVMQILTLRLRLSPGTLMNWREELCKDTASSAAFTESLVRPHDVHVYNNGFGGEFRFAKPIGKGPDFVMWVLKEEHLCQLNVSPVLPIDVAYMQQSSSYRSPVLKKENTCSCQRVATVRQPFSPQFQLFKRSDQ